MPHFPAEHIPAVRQRLLDGMKRYMKALGKGCRYTQEDIARCATVVDGYLAEVANSAKLSGKKIRGAVKHVVLDLNALNEKCGGSLIETDQREALCEIILVAAKQAGLDSTEDITQEWREW